VIEVLLSVTLVLAGVAIFSLSFRLWAVARRAAQGARTLEDYGRAAAGMRAEAERLRRTLDEREAWWSALFNTHRDLVLVHGITPAGVPGPFLMANRAACRELGYTPERILTLCPLDIEDAPQPASLPGFTRTELATLTDEEILERQNMTSEARRTMARVLEEGQAMYERTYVTRTGRRFPVEICAWRVATAGGARVLCVAHDITERRRVQRALRESEQRFQDFFAQSPIGVAMYDGEHRLVNVNAMCLRMFGAPNAEEFSRLDFFRSPWLAEEGRRGLARGQSVSFEAPLDFDELRGQGACVSSRTGRAHFEIRIHNMGLDQEFRPKGFLAQVQDVSRRREAEQALILSERQLRQAQKMEAIGTLAGGIAHDFNNILTPIVGYTEMVLDALECPGPLREYLEEVLKASHRARELVGQILTFSRQGEREGQPVQIAPIFKEVAKQIGATLPQTIRMNIVLKAEQDVVIAHPTQIHQLLTNLCTNAVHAMGESGGVLELRLADVALGEQQRRASPHLAAGRYLRISVKDTGCGMDAPTLERIFEPFFTTKPSGEGTGMGLAVVHGIVTSLQGHISVESRPREGTTFHVLLPAAPKAELRAREENGPVPGGRECVLFVDDERDILRMEGHMLESLGYQPVLAGGAEEALRLFRLSPDRFDLVITDQVMPGCSGLELARALLALRPRLPVILCTGFSETVTEDEALALGVRAFLLKPVGMRQMAETIRNILRGEDIQG
jgi:PAS domain S-box-containing protein